MGASQLRSGGRENSLALLAPSQTVPIGVERVLRYGEVMSSDSAMRKSL